MTSQEGRPPIEHPAFSRRALVQLGGVGLLGLGMHHLDQLRLLAAPAAGPSASPPAKRVVFVFLSGGVPQHDTFDPKPDAPASIRGEFRPIATSTAGIEISEHLPLLAQRSRLWALCRSLTHSSDDHDAGHQIMLSGHSDLPSGFLGFQSQATNWPAIAAMVNSAARGRQNLPPAVVLPEKIIRTDNLQPWSGQVAGRLGSQWDPWFIEAAPWCQRGWGPCPNCYDGVINDGTPHEHASPPIFRPPALTLPEDVGLRRFSDRVALLSLLDGQRRFLEKSAEGGGYSQFAQKAISVLASSGTRRALSEVMQADAATLDRFGRNKYGWAALLAARLIEAGVSLVQVNFGKASSWDTHVANFLILKNFLLPAADRALAALLDDLCDRGLLEGTLVVVASEFGRTPRINNSARPGRDHWGAVQTVLFAGGGVRGGTVVGSSDKIGAHPATDPQTPESMAATIYEALGIPRETTWHDTLDRPHQFYLGEPIAALR
jgi:hypothetical protein